MAHLVQIHDTGLCSDLGSVHTPAYLDTAGMDANAYPAEATGLQGERFLINPTLPEGAEDWAHVVDDNGLRAMTAEEYAAAYPPAPPMPEGDLHI